MSKTKQEYMELAYKDGLGPIFTAMKRDDAKAVLLMFRAQATENAPDKIIPEQGITHHMIHDGRTLRLDYKWSDVAEGDRQLLLTDCAFPVGLELDDLFNAVYKVNIYDTDNINVAREYYLRPTAARYPAIDTVAMDFIGVSFSVLIDLDLDREGSLDTNDALELSDYSKDTNSNDPDDEGPAHVSRLWYDRTTGMVFVPGNASLNISSLISTYDTRLKTYLDSLS